MDFLACHHPSCANVASSTLLLPTAISLAYPLSLSPKQDIINIPVLASGLWGLAIIPHSSWWPVPIHCTHMSWAYFKLLISKPFCTPLTSLSLHLRQPFFYWDRPSLLGPLLAYKHDNKKLMLNTLAASVLGPGPNFQKGALYSLFIVGWMSYRGEGHSLA